MYIWLLSCLKIGKRFFSIFACELEGILGDINSRESFNIRNDMEKWKNKQFLWNATTASESRNCQRNICKSMISSWNNMFFHILYSYINKRSKYLQSFWTTVLSFYIFLNKFKGFTNRATSIVTGSGQNFSNKFKTSIFYIFYYKRSRV